MWVAGSPEKWLGDLGESWIHARALETLVPTLDVRKSSEVLPLQRIFSSSVTQVYMTEWLSWLALVPSRPCPLYSKHDTWKHSRLFRE